MWEFGRGAGFNCSGKPQDVFGTSLTKWFLNFFYIIYRFRRLIFGGELLAVSFEVIYFKTNYILFFKRNVSINFSISLFCRDYFRWIFVSKRKRFLKRVLLVYIIYANAWWVSFEYSKLFFCTIVRVSFEFQNFNSFYQRNFELIISSLFLFYRFFSDFYQVG
jgi:hypothetical protein